MSDVTPLVLPVIDTKVVAVSWTNAQPTSGSMPEPLEQRLRRAQGPVVQPHAPPPQASQQDEEPISRFPPPPNVASLLPGGRSNPPPANDAIRIEFEESMRVFAEAALELALARPVLISTLEGQLLDLSIEIAQAIVEREVDRDPQLHWALARAALQSIGDGGSATLRTSPDAFDAIIAHLGSDRAEVNGVQVHLVADHTIPGLGCIVDSDQTRIDATLAERLRGARRAFEEERRRSGEKLRMNPEIDLTRYMPLARKTGIPAVEGRLAEVVGLVLEARGCRASIGDIYEVRSPNGAATMEAEVVGLRKDRTLLMPLGDTHGLEVGSPLHKVGHSAYVAVGRGLLGRVIDGLGRPLDGMPLPTLEAERPLHGKVRNPLRRRPIDKQFGVGVRAIDSMLTLGEGQRIGIFAGAGVGKSSLLGMMARYAQMDVAVVALIGERGREVEDFVHRILGKEGLSRAVVVVATSADPPLVRVRGAAYATAIAEYFRAQGLRVLLMMDSVTRYAMALREIGLAVGEPPATKGYTPTVFAALPRLLERAGTNAGPGSITGVYTVLVEGDDLSDPIADAARSILDGHIVLSRSLGEKGHFPAIDLPRSVSRVMSEIASREGLAHAQRAREMLATYREAEDLLAIGAYKRGAVPRLDEALDYMPALEGFLRQRFDDPSTPEQTRQRFNQVWKSRS